MSFWMRLNMLSCSYATVVFNGLSIRRFHRRGEGSNPSGRSEDLMSRRNLTPAMYWCILLSSMWEWVLMTWQRLLGKKGEKR